MSLTSWLRNWTIDSGRRHATHRRGRPLNLEALEVRSVLASGWVGYHDEAFLIGDSLSPAAPLTSDVINFTLEGPYLGDPNGGYPALVFDDANKAIDVVYSMDPWFWGGGPILGIQGQLWSLDAGDWVLRGPVSSIAFSVTDDSRPALSISDAVVIEGDSGATEAVFTVNLSAASDDAVTVNFATASDSAQASQNDFVQAVGLLTFAPGEATKTISVMVNGDTLDEWDESFRVVLSGATNASLPDSQGLGQIIDDDAPPALTISDVTLAEGSVASSFVFTVNLSAASGKNFLVGFATTDGTAQASQNDYVSTSGYLEFALGQTTKTIAVPVLGDTLAENNETFFVNLTSSSATATLADGQATGTILNDDLAVPSLSINDVMLVEGNSGSTLFVFTVSLSGASTKKVKVNFATANGTARTSDNDYTAKSGTLTFAPGETTKTIAIAVKGDRRREANEWFSVDLSGAVGASIDQGRGLGMILDDDGSSSLLALLAADISASSTTKNGRR